MHTLTNVRPSDPDTSHTAAAAASPGREQIKQIVYNTLLEHPDGLTDWELLEATGLDRDLRGSVIKRRQDCGARDTGLRRLSPSGHPCIVWALAAAVGQ